MSNKPKSLNKNLASKVQAKQKKVKVSTPVAKKPASFFDKILNWFR
jgi:hypothetical protein